MGSAALHQHVRLRPRKSGSFVPVNTLEGTILRQFGGVVLGSYGYSISPSSSREAGSDAKSFEHVGGKVGVLDTSLGFGSVDFTSTALVAKEQHVNALFPTMIDASDFALTQSLVQAGVKLKAAVFATGYAPDVVNSPTWSYLQGDEFLSIYRPFSLPDAGTEQMAAALEKYQHFSKSQFPTLFQYETWAGADLMIRGLQMAGANPTRAAVIKDRPGWPRSAPRAQPWPRPTLPCSNESPRQGAPRSPA